MQRLVELDDRLANDIVTKCSRPCIRPIGELSRPRLEHMASQNSAQLRAKLKGTFQPIGQTSDTALALKWRLGQAIPASVGDDTKQLLHDVKLRTVAAETRVKRPSRHDRCLHKQ